MSYRTVVLASVVSVLLSPWSSLEVRAQDASFAPAGPSAVTTAAPASAIPASAPEVPVVPREWFGQGTKWTSWSRMTGDWSSWRTALEDKGFTFTLSNIADASHPIAGEAGATRVGRTLTDVGVELDLKKAGLGSGRVFVGYQHKGGGTGADCAADGQGFSNIDAPDFSRFVEAWYEQHIGSKVRIKVGRSDANSEFAFVDNGAEFINASMGFSPTIFVLPTYPDPRLGVVVQTQPTAWSYAGAGVYNGGPALGAKDFDAIFTIGEAGLRWNRLGGGRVGVGYWHTRGDAQSDAGERTTFATGGQYLVLDQALWTGEAGDHPRTLGAFVQAGMADARVSPISRHLGAGLVASGLVPGRPNDTIGLGVTAVRFGDGILCDAPLRGETNVGGFYKLALSPWLALKPDVQVILNPAGGTAKKTIVVSTLRVEVGF